jgi:hypothetical protein
MRWGVTEDSQNDHSVEKICLLEVKNCQKISLGPNFIVSYSRCKNKKGMQSVPITTKVVSLSPAQVRSTRCNIM